MSHSQWLIRTYLKPFWGFWASCPESRVIELNLVRLLNHSIRRYHFMRNWDIHSLLNFNGWFTPSKEDPKGRLYFEYISNRCLSVNFSVRRKETETMKTKIIRGLGFTLGNEIYSFTKHLSSESKSIKHLCWLNKSCPKSSPSHTLECTRIPSFRWLPTCHPCIFFSFHFLWNHCWIFDNLSELTSQEAI
jgi:hypothetical protein